MAIHQYVNADKEAEEKEVEVDYNVHFDDFDSGFIGPFSKLSRANNAYMALLRMDISSGIVHAKNTAVNRDKHQSITPGFNGLANYGELMDTEVLWIGFQLSADIMDLKDTADLVDFLNNIYLLTNQGEKE